MAALDQLYTEVLRFLLDADSDPDCGQTIQEVFRQLGAKKCLHFGIHNENELAEDLNTCTRLFEVRCRLSVIPTTTLTICRTHSNKSGSCQAACDGLHLCIFFLLSGQCCYGERCLFGHDLATGHNQALLQGHHLGALNMTQLRTLFRLPAVRRGVTLPQVCRYYNMLKGCTKGKECQSLHMCLYYVAEQCKFARRCQRNHEINHCQVTNVLTSYGVKVKGRKLSDILSEVRFYNHKHEAELDEETTQGLSPGCLNGLSVRPKRFGSVPNLPRLFRVSIADESHGAAQRAPSAGRRPRNISESSSTTPTNPVASTAKIEELCLYFLKGTCRFQEKCHLLHSAEPYLWRLAPKDERTDREGVLEWQGLSAVSSLTLERAYSQPQETCCTVTDENGDELTVQFQTMTAKSEGSGQLYHIRRVSTLSSMHSSPAGRLPHATVWLWHWKNRDGFWHEFGMEENGKLPVTSDMLERNYQMSATTPFSFGHFVLVFNIMRLRNTSTDCKFKVRRRPQFMPKSHAESDDGTGSNTDEENRAPSREEEEEEEGKDDQARASKVWTAKDGGREATANKVSASPASVDRFLSPVHDKSEKYMTVKGKFAGTLGVSCRVLNILRVHNPQLEARYKGMKSLMTKESGRQRIQERRLYYAPCPNEDVTTISTNGVDYYSSQTAIRSATAGKGSYFHVNAAQANRSIASAKGRCMFVMKCLIGPWEVLPFANPYNLGREFECFVDDPDHPKTFEIMNPSQVCPEYLIVYQLS